MIRLFFIVEGATELHYVKDYLADHLYSVAGIKVDVMQVKTSKGHFGGVVSYAKVRNDISREMKEMRYQSSQDLFFTTMFDLYHIPNDFPGYAEASELKKPYERVEVMEQAMKKDVDSCGRFIPYIQLHEFEALLFADVEPLLRYYERNQEVEQILRSILADSEGNPELINHITAPSKRIIEQIPSYKKDKALIGSMTAGEIGVERLKERCSHFGDWMTQLERLSSTERVR